jgi:hypothetical protein
VREDGAGGGCYCAADGDSLCGLFDDCSVIELRMLAASLSFSSWNVLAGTAVYRSITVITGHVRAPAAAAETISAPKRAARRFVFHDFLSVKTGAGVAMDGNGGASWERVCA